MESHSRTKDALKKRRGALRVRIDRVQSIARVRGFSCGNDNLDLMPNPILQHFLINTYAEAAKAEAAVRRLDRREIDCCIMCGGDIDSDELERHPYTVNCLKCSARLPTNYADQVRIGGLSGRADWSPRGGRSSHLLFDATFGVR